MVKEGRTTSGQLVNLEEVFSPGEARIPNFPKAMKLRLSEIGSTVHEFSVYQKHMHPGSCRHFLYGQRVGIRLDTLAKLLDMMGMKLAIVDAKTGRRFA